MSKILPRLPIHITLFTRASCGLCTTARDNLAQAWKLRPFEFKEIDVMEKGQERWKDVYVGISARTGWVIRLMLGQEFDVPVIHVARTVGGHGGGVEEEVRKLMHRFAEEEVVSVWDQVRGKGEEGK